MQSIIKINKKNNTNACISKHYYKKYNKNARAWEARYCYDITVVNITKDSSFKNCSYSINNDYSSHDDNSSSYNDNNSSSSCCSNNNNGNSSKSKKQYLQRQQQQ